MNSGPTTRSRPQASQTMVEEALRSTAIVHQMNGNAMPGGAHAGRLTAS